MYIIHHAGHALITLSHPIFKVSLLAKKGYSACFVTSGMWYRRALPGNVGYIFQMCYLFLYFISLICMLRFVYKRMYIIVTQVPWETFN